MTSYTLRAFEVHLIAEALAMAASRHESQSHVTRGHFRAEHDHKARHAQAARPAAARDHSGS